jgi:hypothetical protein
LPDCNSLQDNDLAKPQARKNPKIRAEVNRRSINLMKFPYHVFKKSKKNKAGKSFKKWYYWFYAENEKQIQKACKGCNTRAETEYFVWSF